MMFENKNAFIEIQEQQSNQQVIVNGQIINNVVISYLGLCSNCKTALYNTPPGLSLGDFLSQLDQKKEKQGDFGYCPFCGYKIN